MSNDSETSIRAALRGQRLLVIGGDPREKAIARLARDLELAEVVHCPTRQSDASPRRFESQFRAPDFVLVVWVLGLSRTHHGIHVHRLCREAGLPWIDCWRIPNAGVLIAQIARLGVLAAIQRRRPVVAPTA